MLDDTFHRLSSRFTTDMGAEGGNRGDIGKQHRNGGAAGKGAAREQNRAASPPMERRPTKGNRNCNMQSWERAKPLSRPDVFLETGGGCPVGM